MDSVVTETRNVEKTGVFDKERKERYELTFEYSGVKEKKILVICLNPSSDDINFCDTTTNYILNNLSAMNFSTITICNLFARITGKLKPVEIGSGESSLDYIQSILDREYDAILMGYGNSFIGNKRVEEEKRKLYGILKPYASKLVEIVDKEGRYGELKTIHPLFAGQRFSKNWKLRKHVAPKAKRAYTDV